MYVQGKESPPPAFLSACDPAGCKNVAYEKAPVVRIFFVSFDNKLFLIQ
jgi:hypothetical protein